MTDDGSKEQPKAELALRELELREPDWEALAARVEQHLATATSSDEALFDPPLLAADADERAPGDEPPLVASAPEASAASEAPLVAGTPEASAASEPPPTISVEEGSLGELDEGWASAPEAAGAEVTASSPPEAAPGVARAEDVEAATEIEPDPSEPAAAPASGATGGVSLADLARASMARRGAGEARNIAKESLAVASQNRGQGERPSPRSTAAEPAPRSTARPAAAPASSERPVWIGVGIAAVGLAAGFGLYLAGQNTAPTQTVIVTQPERPATVEAPVAATPEERREALPGDGAESEESPRGHDVASLPLAPTARAEASKAEVTGAPAPDKPTRAPEPPAPGKVAAENVVLEEDGPPQAKPPAPDRPKADAALRPADDTSAGNSERPSAGAAQAAVGAVLGPARSCVAGQASPSTAQVVFGSDGHVKSVSVGGAAAGTPAAGCIEAALKKARVQPFAAPSFTLGVTVRPP